MKNNILIIKHGALGDIILAGSAMQAIREFNKDSYIVCLTVKTYAEILKIRLTLMKSLLILNQDGTI